MSKARKIHPPHSCNMRTVENSRGEVYIYCTECGQGVDLHRKVL